MRKPWKACLSKVWRSSMCAACPVWDQSWLPWSSARSTASSDSARLRSFVVTPACVLPPAAAGARLFKANCYHIATNGFAGPSSRPLGLPSVARPTSETSTNASERLARSPTSQFWLRQRLMARITWQLLTQCRNYTSVAETQYLRSQPAERIACAVSLAKEVQKSLKDPSDFPRRRLSPVAPK